MYILTVRLRLFPASHAPAWHQHLLDHFFFAAEARMETLHGLSSQSIRTRYLKDLFIQWRGVLAAYDEGLVRGDAVLAAAVWRNIFKAQEEVDAVKVAMVGALGDEVVAGGRVEFGNPEEERSVVLMESHLMKQAV
jgi:cytochrome b pre-mRNA-processing protein 3